MTSDNHIPDHKNIDYRGFAFVIHNVHGMLLLHCTRKKKKGPHHQLPGGHIDHFEFDYAIEQCGANPAPNKILMEAAKMGTARELFEETGMDVRGQLERLDPVPLHGKHHGLVQNMLENKLYFVLNVTDEDFLTEQEGLKHSDDDNGKHLALRISHEHSGFIFVNDPLQSVDKIVKHSGGTGAKALRMSMKVNGKGNDNGNDLRKAQVNVGDSNELKRSVNPYTPSNEKGYAHTVDLLPPTRRRQGLFWCFRKC